jgi:glycosyltransferase involved in cell wall biosynthesis
MRILHVISSLDPAIGGPPVVALNLAKAQAALGHDVQIAAEHVPPAQAKSAIVIPRQGLQAILGRPCAEIVAAVGHADVCHLHGVWEPLLLQTAKAARQAGRPYVVTPHGMLDPWSLQQKKWKKRLALALGVRQLLNQAALIHVLNADEQRLLQPLGLTARCAIIPNGMFLEELDPPPNPAIFAAKHGDKPYILFLSRLHYKKGLDVLVEAFSGIAQRYPDIDLVIAGPDDGVQATVEQQAREFGLLSRVRLVGPLYGPMKWSALAGATCFCLPSRQEGFSVAILEAMACRIPVVISDQCHFPEVAEVGAGIVTPVHAPAVSEALRQLLGDADQRRTMGAAGRALVEERFTWNRVAELCLTHYLRLTTPLAAISSQ